MVHDGAVSIDAEIDFLHEGKPCWDIEIALADKTLVLSEGGATLTVDGVRPENAWHALSSEYERLYSRFAALFENRGREMDISPLQLVADAFLIAERLQTVPFNY